MYLNYYGYVLLHLLSNVYQLNLKMTNVCNKNRQESHDACLEYSNSIIERKWNKNLTMMLTLILYLTDTAWTYSLYYIIFCQAFLFITQSIDSENVFSHWISQTKIVYLNKTYHSHLCFYFIFVLLWIYLHSW